MLMLENLDLDCGERRREFSNHLFDGEFCFVCSLFLAADDDGARGRAEFFGASVEVLWDFDLDVFAHLEVIDGLEVGASNEWIEFTVDVVDADDSGGGLYIRR